MDQDDGQTGMPNANDTAAFGSDRLSSHFWGDAPADRLSDPLGKQGPGALSHGIQLPPVPRIHPFGGRSFSGGEALVPDHARRH